MTFFRNTPPLVPLYFFFALASILRMQTETGETVPMVSAFSWAVISLSLFAGVLNTEIFCSGIEAVPKATAEAAKALGFSRWRIYRDIVLPLALRISLPSLGTNLVKTTLVWIMGRWEQALHIPGYGG
ncbi:ABC transporter permease subunit [Paenirhodobacter sp.]|uniref:ABC transporter permease subunit n=1 Tax=Paenirhodobacter sp. TaxID=1965326 RepID=UPI003B3EC36E